MPKNMNNNKKKGNTQTKKYDSSSEVDTSCDSQSEIFNSTSDGTVSEATNSASDDVTVSEDNSSQVSDNSLSDSEDNSFKDENLVRTKPKKTAHIEPKKKVHIKQKTAYTKSKKDVFIEIDMKKNHSVRKYNNFPVIWVKKNYFVNCTKLCKEIAKETGYKKEPRDWFRLNSSKLIMKSVSSRTGIDISRLKFVIEAGIKEIKGTYVHSLIITHIVSWMKSANNILKEQKIQNILQKKLGGEIEVKTDFGCIDILTEKYLIEIKSYKNWKDAIGQLIVYAREYPNRKKILYLFDVPKNNIVDKIKNVCAASDIHIRIHDGDCQ